MKKFTKSIFVITIILGLITRINAQQWSDVGDPGFTTGQSTNVSVFTKMELAMVSGVPHASYVTSSGTVNIVKYVSGAWTSVTSPSAGPSVHNLSSDAAGNLYVTYTNSASGLASKKFNGTSWTTLTTLTALQRGTEIVVNPSTSEPTIAGWCDGCTSKLNVYRHNGTNWIAVGASDFSSATTFANMAITSTGTPYVVFQEGRTGTTFSVMKFDGTSWVLVGASGFGSIGLEYYTDIAVDASGAPYVVSINSTSAKASVLKYNGTNWVNVGSADFTAGGVQYPKLEFDNSGALHIVYRDVANSNRASVMKFNGTAWVQVGMAGLSGGGAQFPALKFDNSNVPFTLFRDATLTGSPGTVMKLCSSNSTSISGTTPASRCGAGLVTLSASGTGTLRWYSSATNGNFLGTGTSFTTPSIGATTTYSVASYDGNGCSSPRTAVVATVNLLPLITTSLGASRCGPGTATVSATPTAGTVNWYTQSVGGSSIGSGTSFNTPSVSVTTPFFAEALNNGCASATRTQVDVTVTAFPQSPAAMNGSTCGSGNVDIMATAPTGATISWFQNPTGGSSLGSGEVFTTPSLTASTPFYAQSNINGCASTIRTQVYATIFEIPNIISAASASRCGDGTVTLSCQTTGDSGAEWFTSETDPTPISNLKVFNTPTLSETTVYYVRATSSGCISPTRTQVVATINVIPSFVSVGNGSNCGIGQVNLFASPSSGDVQWFTSASGGTSIGTGESFTTPEISTSTTFYAEAQSLGCTSLDRAPVVANIKTIPSVENAVDGFTCGMGSVNLSALASPSGASLSWFTNSIGGSALGTGNSLTTPIINSNTLFYAEASLDGCLSNRLSVTAEVRPVPFISSTLGGATCNQGAINLSAIPSTDAQLQWFDVSAGGVVLGNESTFTTPVITSTRTYFVGAIQNGCSSTSREPVVATIKPYPTITASNVSRCDAGSVVLQATSNGIVSWFAANTGGTSLASGLSFTTPSITTSTSYFVESTLNGCTTPSRVSVQAVVNNTPAQPTITQNNLNIEAPVLTSSATSGNQWFKNDVAIVGATSTTYVITEAGIYKVQANNSGCLSPFSSTVNYVITGFEIADSKLLSLYPNPTSSELIIDLTGFQSGRVQVKMIDELGRLTLNEVMAGGESVQVNVRNLYSGKYFILAQQGNRKVTKAFIKTY